MSNNIMGGDNKMSKEIWIIGAGDMAVEYSRVLTGMGLEYEIIGKSEKSAQMCEKETGHMVIRGGIEQFLNRSEYRPQYAIVTVQPLLLKDVSIALLQAGVKNLLVEKPAGINHSEISILAAEAKQRDAKVFVAYNRRFYASTIEAKRIIQEDGGVTSFSFEFTEWGHVVSGLNKPKDEFDNWFMANSTHVADLAYYLGGVPAEISAYTAGGLDWHSRAAQYAGAGVTELGIPFSYKADWESAGRWSVEIHTRNRKLLLEPMEELREQLKGTVKIEKKTIDDHLDIDYKPGLFLQTKAFLGENHKDLLDIAAQVRMSEIYEKMDPA